MKIGYVQAPIKEQAQLEEFLNSINQKDVVVVLGISRMERNTKGLLKLIEAMAELEKTSTTEHRTGKMVKAHKGRPRIALDNFESIYHQVKAGTKSASQGAKELGIARSTWYRRVKDREIDWEIDF